MAAGKTNKKANNALATKQPALQKAPTKKAAKKTGPGKPAAVKRATPVRLRGTAAATTKAPPKTAPATTPKCVIILRGLPGAGKSTRAEQLAAAARAAGRSAAIHSTDSFFTDPRTGEYRFSFSMLQRNHERNFSAFCSSLQDNIHTVIVDNTNILRQYYERYEEEAEEQGYKVQIEVIGEFSPSAARVYAARNVHGVPYEKVMQMLEQWQEIEEDGGCTDGYDSEDDFSSEDEYSDDY
ncbi:hypothetical protein OEZ85_007116 [Tetradesmus obliquus]|uniref:Uncharacterized protein n=1 Tax=Tetradesmus obliquus TaxID=3088 RepID=A0ABY8TWN7_TETOB|nr:hypothetical protein OEZ85_007116 [Tetradesmus obliquus]